MPTGPSTSSPDTLRVDAPHHVVPVVAGDVVEPKTPVSPSEPTEAAEKPAEFIGGMQRQASELAEGLRDRQRQLDHREAQLNARAESLEQESRRLRLRDELQQTALQEQTALLAESRESAQQEADETQARQRELAQQIAAQQEKLATETHAVRHREETLELRQVELENEQEKLHARELAIDARERALEFRNDELARRELRQQRSGDVQPSSLAEVTQLREQLQEANRQLREKIAESESQRMRWEQRQSNAVREQATRRREQDAIYQQKLHAVKERLEALNGQKASLDIRETMVEKSKLQVAEAQRETLEMRIIVEELWARLSPTVAPAELSLGFAKAQQRLQQHFQLSLDSIRTQTEQLQASGAIIEQKFVDLKAQTESLRQWRQQRLEEIEAQAARLIARENELHRETQRVERAEASWRAEKRDLEIQLNQLAGEQPSRAA